MTLKFAESLKTYNFSYSNLEGDIFAVDLPEDLRRLLRVLPVPITQSLVRKLEDTLKRDDGNFPADLELESRLLEMV